LLALTATAIVYSDPARSDLDRLRKDGCRNHYRCHRDYDCKPAHIAPPSFERRMDARLCGNVPLKILFHAIAYLPIRAWRPGEARDRSGASGHWKTASTSAASGSPAERTPGIWLWHVQVNIPGAPFGSAASLDDAKAAFKTPSRAFKEKLGPDKLATAYAVMNKRP
jgi:hypothetical protein